MMDAVRKAWWCGLLALALIGCADSGTTDPGPGVIGGGGNGGVAGSGGTGGGSADRLCAGGATRCVVTTQTPELTIGRSGGGTLYIVNGSAQSIEEVQYSETVMPMDPRTVQVPGEAGLLPRQSYQWTFLLDNQPASEAVWQSFTVDFVRAGKEPVDTFGPLRVGLASQTLQTGLQSQAVQTASGTVRLGLSHRGAYLGTVTGAPYFVEDPSGALPEGWVLSGVDANVPWVSIEEVGGGGSGGTGGSGGSAATVRSVVLQAYDGSLLQYTNQGEGTGSWSPPVGFGRPHGTYGSLRLSEDQKTFTWSSRTNVVTFEQSSQDSGRWLAKTAQVVLPGSGDISPGLEVSWDSAGRLKTISDQSSVNENGVPSRVATLFYGGESGCPTTADPGYEVAPTGHLCALEHMDGTVGEVQYVKVKPPSGPDLTQLGRVKLPGGAVWSFSWGTQTVMTDSGNITYTQLSSVQTPRGYDAEQQGKMAGDDTVWSVVYDSGPFGSGALQGLVSPLPTVGAASTERLGRFYTYASLDNPDEASVHWAQISGTEPSTFALSAGAKIQTLSFDAAWRRTGLTQFLDDTTSYDATFVWDEALDQQRSVTFAGATQTQSYDFLGRSSTVVGPGSAQSTTAYDEGNARGLVGTVYGNAALEAPGRGSVLYAVTDGSGQIIVSETSPPSGVSSESFSLELRGFVQAPSAGALSYTLSTDTHGTATLYVNGSCAHGGSPPPTCASNNTASTLGSTEAGDPIELVVQYVRDGTAVSASAPIEVTLRGPGIAKTETVAGLQSGLGLVSRVSATETLSVGADAVTLSRVTAWENGLFQTQTSQTLPGLDGKLVTVPSYEANYDPGQSEWKRPVSSLSPGGSTWELHYWDNTGTGSANNCNNTDGVVQAGQDQARLYPAPNTKGASGLERQRAYDRAGRLASFSAVPEGKTSGVSGCQAFDGRGRRTLGRVEAYTEGSTTGGAKSEAWRYPDQTDGFTTRVTHTWEAPPTPPSCATQMQAPYTCTEAQETDLLGRTAKRTDVWGTERTSTYALDATTGELTQTDTLTLSDRTVTTTLVRNRLGSLLSLRRTDSTASQDLSASYGYDAFGRIKTVRTEVGTNEVVTATYDYDAQSRVDQVTWTRAEASNQETVLENALTLSDNSPRTLGESFSYGEASYDYAYTFNEAGWLTEAKLSGTDGQNNTVNASWSYAYATSSGTNPNAYLNGNVTEVTTTGVATGPSGSFSYNYVDQVEGTGVVHDGLGNLTAYGDDSLDYDQTNQVTSLSDGTTTVSFSRTPRGTVYQKSTDSTAIGYALDGVVLDDTGAPTSHTLRVGTLLVRFDLTDASSDTFTVTSLQGGHALLTLDAEGAPVAPNESELTLYGPWGNPVQAAPTPSADRPLYGWQGLLGLETNLGVVLMGERMYHKDLGRFTSVDPVFQGGLTAYSFGRNDWINNADPRGTLSTAAAVALDTVGFLATIGTPLLGVLIPVRGEALIEQPSILDDSNIVIWNSGSNSQRAETETSSQSEMQNAFHEENSFSEQNVQTTQNEVNQTLQQTTNEIEEESMSVSRSRTYMRLSDSDELEQSLEDSLEVADF